jgi:hypothetical protein
VEASEENQMGYMSEEKREEQGNKKRKRDRKLHAFSHRGCNIYIFNFGGQRNGGSSYSS